MRTLPHTEPSDPSPSVLLPVAACVALHLHRPPSAPALGSSRPQGWQALGSRVLPAQSSYVSIFCKVSIRTLWDLLAAATTIRVPIPGRADAPLRTAVLAVIPVARPGHERFDLKVLCSDQAAWDRFAELIASRHPRPGSHPRAIVRPHGAWPPPHRHNPTAPCPIWDRPTISRNSVTTLSTWNIRGAKSSLPELHAWTRKHRPCVIALQETFISVDHNNCYGAEHSRGGFYALGILVCI
jgi:hypothetical protein